MEAQQGTNASELARDSSMNVAGCQPDITQDT